jgi:FkbM family methyltransferase
VKSIAKKAGFRITRNYFGVDQWQDVVTVLGRHPEVVFDVGANIGQTATTLVRHFPDARIHCFEPFPNTFATLEKAVAHYPKVVARNLGFGAEESRQSLYFHTNSQWNSMLKVSEEIARFPDSDSWAVSREANTVQVEVSTIDRYCRSQQINQIDLLKTDTQGYELSVLKGAREMLASKRIRMVYMEINFVTMYDGQSSFEDLYHYMRESGYKLSGLYDRSFCEDRSLMYCDGLFVA